METMFIKKIRLQEIEGLVGCFETAGGIAAILPFGSGHINDTYRIVNAVPGYPDYLLQRINHEIFTNVPRLIDNINQVTSHLKNKFKAIGYTDVNRRTLTLIAAKDGEYFHRDAKGQFWRLYLFLLDTRSYDVVQTERQAYEGGKALGQFQNLLADLDAAMLHPVIPDFHSIHFRCSQLASAIFYDELGRAAEVAAEIEFVHARAKRMAQIELLGDAGKLPLRVTHNDTKFNNILFDAADRAQCIIDLDTIMPGYMAFDFGDAVRTLINTAAEDEADLDKIKLNIPLFKAFSGGFLSETASYMSTTELESLRLGILLLPYLMGLRFLTDYINGDTYYKTALASHNLQRARAQFRLLEKLEEAYPKLCAIVQ